jgi:hypothetical protein
MVSVNSTSLLKTFGFVAVRQLIMCVCVCVTHTHKQEWIDVRPQNWTILTKKWINWYRFSNLAKHDLWDSC